MHKLAQIPSALHVDDLFNNSNILQLETNPAIPEISHTWYCAKDVVKTLGQVWHSANRTLKPIPEHHKAELAYQSAGGSQNVWCLSKTGVCLMHAHVFGCDPFGSRGPCSTIVKGGASVNTDIGPDYAELLSEARSRPSPLTLMLLLDALTRDAVVHLEEFRLKFRDKTWNLKRGLKHQSTTDVLPLIWKLPADEQRQVVDYIDWLINEEGA